MTAQNVEHDMVRRDAALIAGALKLAAYRVRDPETGAFSELQFHATYNNTILGMFGEDVAVLFAKFIDETVHLRRNHEQRVDELLRHTNRQLEELRTQRRLIKSVRASLEAALTDIGEDGIDDGRGRQTLVAALAEIDAF